MSVNVVTITMGSGSSWLQIGSELILTNRTTTANCSSGLW
jgi:hypothetical protein